MIADFYVAMLFSTSIRVTADEKYRDQVDKYVHRCNRRGDSLVDYWREMVVPQAFIYGIVDIFTDLPSTSEPVNSLADQQQLGLDQPYSFVVPPLQRVRWQIDDSGNYKSVWLYPCRQCHASPLCALLR
jgi:hypothetical protein